MDSERGENVITLYTLKTCDKCKQLKDGLDKNGINYNNIYMEDYGMLADRIEKLYRCEKYPMVIYAENIWLPESSSLPSTNIAIYNTIPELIKMIKSKIK
jgi:glutaredoxin